MMNPRMCHISAVHKYLLHCIIFIFLSLFCMDCLFKSYILSPFFCGGTVSLSRWWKCECVQYLYISCPCMKFLSLLSFCAPQSVGLSDHNLYWKDLGGRELRNLGETSHTHILIYQYTHIYVYLIYLTNLKLSAKYILQGSIHRN
jgi:hypothetical protein